MNPNNIKPKKKHRRTVFSSKKIHMTPKEHMDTQKLTKGSFDGKRWVPYDK